MRKHISILLMSGDVRSSRWTSTEFISGTAKHGGQDMQHRMALHLLVLATTAGAVVATADTEPPDSSAPATSPGGTETATSAAGGFEGEPVTVRVTTLSLCTEAPHWGVAHGFFADEGIEIEFVPAQGGAAGLDAVEAGAADIAFANPVAVVRAIDAGRDLTVVGGTGVSNADNNGVIVRADNPAQSPADLAGQTIGINEIGGLGWVMTRAWIEADGGDPEAAEFVALGFPELVPAVEGGQVDAAQVTGPQTAAAHDNPNLRVLGNPFFEVVGPIPTAFYAAKTSFLEENPDVMERWGRAYEAAVADFDDPANRDQQFEEMSEICQTEPEVLAGVPYSEQQADIDLESFQLELDLLTEAGVIEEGKVAGDLVADFAEASAAPASTTPASTAAA
jgi:NitT/TauT family transport system substrate-binding protein